MEARRLEAARGSAAVVVPVGGRFLDQVATELWILIERKIQPSPNRGLVGIGLLFTGRLSFDDERLCLLTHG